MPEVVYARIARVAGPPCDACVLAQVSSKAMRAVSTGMRLRECLRMWFAESSRRISSSEKMRGLAGCRFRGGSGSRGMPARNPLATHHLRNTESEDSFMRLVRVM